MSDADAQFESESGTGSAWRGPGGTPPPGSPPSAVPVSAASRRTLRIRPVVILAVLGSLLLLITGCTIAVRLLVRAADTMIDPTQNARTPLADGSYLLRPQTRVSVNGRCAFSGVAYDAAGQQVLADSVTVVGDGRSCVDAGQVTLVAFTVEQGTARIDRVG